MDLPPDGIGPYYCMQSLIDILGIIDIIHYKVLDISCECPVN